MFLFGRLQVISGFIIKRKIPLNTDKKPATAAILLKKEGMKYIIPDSKKECYFLLLKTRKEAVPASEPAGRWLVLQSLMGQ
jgi:hypothetical protein